MAVAWPVVTECHTLILHRMGIQGAQVWLEELVAAAGLLNPIREDYLEACLRIRSYPDQDISLTDAVVAALSEQTGFPVWTFDHHFDVMGASVWR